MVKNMNGTLVKVKQYEYWTWPEPTPPPCKLREGSFKKKHPYLALRAK